jgi:hypothetical protein
MYGEPERVVVTDAQNTRHMISSGRQDDDLVSGTQPHETKGEAFSSSAASPRPKNGGVEAEVRQL